MTTIRTVTIHGCPTAVLDLPGTDPSQRPRVFPHGPGSSSIATFSGIATPSRSRKARSILVDLPGFGYSTTHRSPVLPDGMEMEMMPKLEDGIRKLLNGPVMASKRSR